MSGISAVTVTLNNARGLRQTLASLAALQHPLLEVVIVDGGSTDDTTQVVCEFEAQLPLSFRSEPDGGIYHAMNKGKARSTGDLIHYLNAGDTVFGEPYRDVTQPCLLPVHLHDEVGNFFFEDFVRHGGYAYCHQGILFPRDHPAYDLRYRVAADLDLMIACFPSGLRGLPRTVEGGVRFDLGGASSTARRVQSQEFRSIFYRRLPWPVAMRLHAAIALKELVPRPMRRALIRLRSGRRSSVGTAP